MTDYASVNAAAGRPDADLWFGHQFSTAPGVQLSVLATTIAVENGVTASEVLPALCEYAATMGFSWASGDTRVSDLEARDMRITYARDHVYRHDGTHDQADAAQARIESTYPPPTVAAAVAADVPVGLPAGPGAPDTAALGAALIAAAVRCCVQPDPDTAHTPDCPAYGYPPRTTDLTEQARRAVGQAPVLADVVERLGDVALSDLVGWARDADARVAMSPDGFLWCTVAYTVGVCRFTSNARLQADTDGLPDPTPVRSLLVWLARHWECTGG